MSWSRRLVWMVGALLLLWAATWLAVPPLVKWQAEKQLSELTGRQVTVGEISFHPWSLQLTIGDLAIAAAPGSMSAEPQFHVARLQVDVDVRSLLRLAPVVESLQIDAPRLRLARTADGRYDIDDVLLRLAPKPREPRGGETPRFAIYNVELHDGEVLFDDAPVKRQHRLGGLTLTLPFLSNLPSQVDVTVEPRLAFTLDGATYDSGAAAVPFASSRSGTLTLRVAAVDLEPYLGYLPETLPLRLQRGHVSADLAMEFAVPEQGDARVTLRGKVGASELALAEPGGAPLLALSQVSLDLKDVRPLARKVSLGALRIEGLELNLARDVHGVVSVQRLLPVPAPAAAAASASVTAPKAAWQASLDSFELVGARVLWNDEAVRPASSWVLDGLALSARQLRLPASEPMPFALKATLRPQGDASATLAVVSLDGQASETSASAKFDLSGLALAAAAPYVNAASHVQVAGTGAANGRFEWAAGTPSQAQRMLVALDEVTFDGLIADDPTAGKAGKRGETVSMQRVQLAGVTVDLASQSITVASAKLQRPQVRLERSADGVWNLMRLAGPTPLAESERPLVRAAAEALWQFRLDDFALDDGRVRLVDAAPAPARAGAAQETVRLSIDKLRLGLQGLQLRGNRLVSTPKLQLSARIADDHEADAAVKPSLVDWRGRFGLQPLLVAGKARIERFPVHAVQSYVPHDLGVRLRSADAGFQGEVSMRQDGASGMRVDASGDILLADLILDSRRNDAAAGTPAGDSELLSWQSFAINGVKVALRPGEVPKVAIRDATLSDFFARLVLTEEGRLNLRDVAPVGEPTAASAAANAASAPVAAAPAASTPIAARPLPVELELGGLRLANGRVDYSDRFVKPNFSAALTELNGNLGAFRTGSGEPATLQLSGRAAGTGLLEISGRLKPGSVPRELDISAKATDLELAPLSTYAGKYAGYAIERGKLSVAVHYRIDPDGKLDASHQVILNQLTFGERVESPTATKLPVLFAVSLLKDRNGVIDINLPVSGTLNDPQFSLGPIIWKVILNLLAKAVTAPFALLSGGGGPDLSAVAFQPGTSEPTDDGTAALDKVANALTDRPALKMTVVGQADADTEREAYQRAVVEQRLLQEQRREQLRASGAASAPDTTLALAPSDRARFVKAVYRQTDLPEKPRNLIGMQADIPTDEMEALLRKHVSVSPEAMRELALRRGLAVRGALIEKGLASDRLFLGDPRLHVGGSGEAAWTPQVKLTLDTK
jgi:uncharacterized protein involved in outer membrane biogenesis